MDQQVSLQVIIMSKPELKISVFSDYICPFCYIGNSRINQLRDDYELKVNWCLIEIHPETPAQGMPTSKLNYTPEHWQALQQSMHELLEAEGLPFKASHDFTTNSHKALLLAEASKKLGADTFYKVHNRLFEAFFVDGINIGDEAELLKIAAECDIPPELANNAFTDDELEEHLKLFLQFAVQSKVSGVPTTVIGEQALSGVSSLKTLKNAAAQASTQAPT